MSAVLLQGEPLAASLLAAVRQDAAAFAERRGRPPTLAVVRVGEDPDAAVYTRSLLRRCRAVGIRGEDVRLEGATTEGDVVARVRQMGDRADVDAIIIQTPLPPTIRRAAVLAAIPPIKDVDGLTAENAGLLTLGQPRHVPATARALLLLAEAAGRPLAGARAVVVGRSAVVGLPVMHLLIQANATVTVCHRATADLAAETRRATLLVVAAGRPGLVGPDMVAPGAVVLDAGTTMTPEGLRGDVDPAVAEVAGVLTPVPGGVGPVTTTVLLRQVIAAAQAGTEEG